MERVFFKPMEFNFSSTSKLLLNFYWENDLNYCRKKNIINATMKTELKTLILKKIKQMNIKAFSCYDFTEFASYKTISKSLQRMEENDEIKRILNGVYCLNRFDDVLKLPLLPTINEVVECIARKHKWTICPAGNLALNILGLSTQVPANYLYLSNGPYKEYFIYGTKVSLKRTMNREISDYSYKTLLLIQSIKALGEDKINDQTLNKFKLALSSLDKQRALKETTTSQAWIRNVIVQICKE